MLERRRSHLRRAFYSAIVLAPLGVLPLCAMEVVYALEVGPPFDSTVDAVRFIVSLIAVPVAAAALAGALLGPVVLGVSKLASTMAQQRLAEPRWLASIYSVLAAPAIALIVSRLLSGRRAQQLPVRPLIVLVASAIAVVATYGAVRLIVGVRDRMRLRRWGRPHGVALFFALVAVAALLYTVDQRVLPRLYPAFHLVVALVAVLACQLAFGALYASWRPKVRWMRRLFDPAVAAMAGVAAVALGAWGLTQVDRSEDLRFRVYEHTVVQSKLFRLASAIGLCRTADLSPPVASLLAPQPISKPAMSGPRVTDANLLLVTVDALRADHVGAYGYERPTTPNIDGLAKRAVVFNRAYCPVPHTSFSVTSLMTASRVFSAGTERRRTVASVLRRYGYKTAGFFSPVVFFIDGERFTQFAATKYDFEYVKYEYLGAKERVDQVLAFLRENGTRKFFVWVHFFEAHDPYVSPPEIDFGVRDVDRYDAAVAYVDREVGRLLRHIEKRHPKTVVALTADHGEAFGEHGSHYHGTTLYDEQVRVPAVIAVPGVKPRKVDGAVQGIDLMATMLSAVDLPVPADMQGRDLGPWLAGESADKLPPAFVEIRDKKAVVKGRWKLIHDVSHNYSELYDLDADPHERVNLAGRHKQTVLERRSELFAWMKPVRSAGKQTGRELARLFERARGRDPGVVPALMALYHDGTPDQRREAIGYLVTLRAREAEKLFEAARKSPDPGIRIPAQIGATLLGDKMGLTAVRSLLKRPDLPPTLAREALIALAVQGRDRAAMAPLVRRLRASTDTYERELIIVALGRLGDVGAADALREQLERLRQRPHAIEALGLVGARVAVPELARAVQHDEYTHWRESAARALGRIGDRRAVRPLQRALRREPEGAVAAEILVALDRLAGLPAPGLRRVDWAGEWKCKGGSCVRRLDQPCGAAQDLLLQARELARDVAVLCGDSRVGELRPLRQARHEGSSKAAPAAASVVGLHGHGGELALSVVGEPVQLGYLALRRSVTSGPTARTTTHRQAAAAP